MSKPTAQANRIRAIIPMVASPPGVKMSANITKGTSRTRERKFRRFQIPWPMEMMMYRYKPVAGALSKNDSAKITSFAAISSISSRKSAFAS